MKIQPLSTSSPSAEEGAPLAAVLAVWRAIGKNWVLTVGVAGSVILATTFFTLGQTKIFRSATTIEIDPNPPRPLGNQVQAVVEMGTGSYLNNKEYFETQYKILQSTRIAAMTVRELGLQRDPGFIANAPAGSTATGPEASLDATVAVLLTRLEVEPIKNSRLAIVSFEDANPQRAQRVATTLVDKYRENNLDTVLNSTTSAVDWLQGQLANLYKELESSEMALHDYKKDRSILSVSLDDQSSMLREEMTKLNDELTSVGARKEHLSAKLVELNRVVSADPASAAATDLLGDPLLQKLRVDLANAAQTRNELLGSGKGENHPSVAGATASMEAIKASLVQAIADVRVAVERESASISREAGGLRSLYQDAERRALDLNLMEIEYSRLRRSKDNAEKLYSMVLERTKESDLTRMIRVNNVSVIEPASLPRRPVKPLVPMNMALGTMVGLVLGVVVALSREMMDRSVKTPDDVERDLGSVLLGVLPQFDAEIVATNGRPTRRGRRGRAKPLAVADDGLGGPELVVHRHPTSGVAEAARAIRTNILFMDPDRPFRALLVTSAAPFEGKTTVACCIAIAMAQAGQRVVLVDCDMRRPRIHKVFGCSSAEGITTALLDISALDRTVTATPIPNLHVLPCGPIPPNPAELLHSESFGRVLDVLKERFDRVVIDSPPLVPVTDGAVLSARVDGTVLVMRAFRTSKDLGKRALRSLHDVGGRVIGCVLNAVDLTRGGYGYYQQYYYYRREGYASEAHAPQGQPRDDAPPPAA